jgi:predicted DNA-binding protein
MPRGKPKDGGGAGKQVNFRASDDLYARLEETADALGLDLSNLVRMVLNEHLAEYEGRAEQIKTRRKGKP